MDDWNKLMTAERRDKGADPIPVNFIKLRYENYQRRTGQFIARSAQTF